MRDERLPQTDVIEQIERRRMEGRGAQIGFYVRSLLYKGGMDACARQQKRCEQSDRAPSNDRHFDIAGAGTE